MGITPTYVSLGRERFISVNTVNKWLVKKNSGVRTSNG
jgi:hypothetical protein